LAWLRPQIKDWRKFTIAIDGVDGAGKSPLARFLAWQLQMPAIGTDLALIAEDRAIHHKNDLVKALIESRHNRPVIVEGVFILRTPTQIEIDPDVLIRVEAEGQDGSIRWQQEYMNYKAISPRSTKPDFVLNWSPSEE
jgi:uridine kinase